MPSTIEPPSQARLACNTGTPHSPGIGPGDGARLPTGHAYRVPGPQPATVTAGVRAMQWVGTCLRAHAPSEVAQRCASHAWLAGLTRRLRAIRASAARPGQSPVPDVEQARHGTGDMPAVVANGGRAIEANALPSHASATRAQLTPRKRPAGRGHVLLVEDSDINRTVAEAMLEHLGCTVHAVTDGEQAITVLQSGCFDLVLMDVRMPVLDGIEATRRIRTQGGARASVPIVALTASVIVGDRERFIAAGMDDYLAKPFPMQSLASLLQRWLPGTPGARTSTA